MEDIHLKVLIPISHIPSQKCQQRKTHTKTDFMCAKITQTNVQLLELIENARRSMNKLQGPGSVSNVPRVIGSTWCFLNPVSPRSRSVSHDVKDK